MSSKVEDWFITPLEAHFEAQPTDGGRITILDDLEPYSTDELGAAVEWLKRGRQSVKTFPSPKECLKAIAAVAGKAKARELAASGGRITAENYGECAVAYNAGRDKVPVIERGTPQWDEWVAYYEWLGVRWILSLIAERDKWTVPAHFPSDFDPRFRMQAKARAA
jgi:hypothetical protein